MTLRDLTEDEIKLFDLIQKGDTTEAINLIENGKVRLNCLDKSGMTPLDQACFKGDEELADFLISQKGADVDNRAHEQGYTCLMFAALAGKPRLCQMLLDAGARAHALNSINKTASELAAFVGQHECVSVISSYIDYSDVDKIVHPRGEESDQIYPKEFVKFIHDLTKTHYIHPVRIIFDIVQHSFIIEHRKKLLYTIDMLFERQLRSKEPNETSSLKLWLILFFLRELLKFVDEHSGQGKTPTQLMQTYAKKLITMTPADTIRPNEETLLRNAVRAFPYHHSLVFQTLVKSIAKVKFGERPTSFYFICQALFGMRFVHTATFCATCGVPSAHKRCGNCKTLYCSQECQKFDWVFHKNCCEAIKNRPTENSCEELTEEQLEALAKESKGENKEIIEEPPDSSQAQIEIKK